MKQRIKMYMRFFAVIALESWIVANNDISGGTPVGRGTGTVKHNGNCRCKSVSMMSLVRIQPAAQQRYLDKKRRMKNAGIFERKE